MKFELLPGIPRVWLDFLNSGLYGLAAPSSIADLARHANDVMSKGPEINERLIQAMAGGAFNSDRKTENIRRLSSRQSVVVAVELYAGLFGGPLAQLLKCLTAVKLCEELAGHSVNAVPIACVNTETPLDFPKWSVNLIDPEGEIQTVSTDPFVTAPQGRIAQLIRDIKEIGRESFDPEILEVLEASYSSGASFSSALVRLMSDLLREWGVIILDLQEPLFSSTGLHSRGAAGSDSDSEPGLHSTLALGSALPLLAQVVDSHDVQPLSRAAALLRENGREQPLGWPQVSATLVDAKTRRILSRYDLALQRLYSGPTEAMQSIRKGLPRHLPGKLQAMVSEFESRIARIHAPDSFGGDFSESADSCREKVVYQLDKLRHHAEAALKQKEEIAGRHIRRACNFLAPNGRLQEKELAGIQILLSHSLAGLRQVYSKLSISDFEHQILGMD